MHAYMHTSSEHNYFGHLTLSSFMCCLLIQQRLSAMCWCSKHHVAWNGDGSASDSMLQKLNLLQQFKERLEPSVAGPTLVNDGSIFMALGIWYASLLFMRGQLACTTLCVWTFCVNQMDAHMLLSLPAACHTAAYHSRVAQEVVAARVFATSRGHGNVMQNTHAFIAGSEDCTSITA